MGDTRLLGRTPSATVSSSRTAAAGPDMQQGPGGVPRGPALVRCAYGLVARLLRAATVGRAATVDRTPGGGELAVGLGGGQTDALAPLLDLDLRRLLDRLE